jgi:hypothetical protein
VKFNFNDLDDTTRSLMQEEISRAAADGQIYLSTRFNSTGNAHWIQWLTDAAKSHDEHWLAYQIEAHRGMKDFEGKSTPSGGYTVAHVPHTAAETMAEGQFNRFYIAAICRRAIDAGTQTVEVYRARVRQNPRPESVALEGKTLDANELLKQVCDKSKSFGCDLIKPNSGLSIQLRA